MNKDLYDERFHRKLKSISKEFKHMFPPEKAGKAKTDEHAKIRECQIGSPYFSTIKDPPRIFSSIV